MRPRVQRVASPSADHCIPITRIVVGFGSAAGEELLVDGCESAVSAGRSVVTFSVFVESCSIVVLTISESLFSVGFPHALYNRHYYCDKP